MVKMEWTADGLWAWFENHPGELAAAEIRSMVRKAQKQAFKEWCTMSAMAEVGLPMRFSQRAFSLLNLSPRSSNYQKNQRRNLGAILPYVAPNRTTIAFKGKEARSYPSGQMRSLVTGGGYRITNQNNGSDAVTSEMTVTGANVLNVLASTKPEYRREFLGFDRGGRKDAEWIQNRSNELSYQYLTEAIRRAKKRRIRWAMGGG